MLSPDEMARLLGQEAMGMEGMTPGGRGGPGDIRAPLYVGGGFGGLGGPSVGPAPLRDSLGLRPGGGSGVNTGLPMGASRTGAPIDPLTMAILGILATQGPVGGAGPQAQGSTPAPTDPGNYGLTADRGDPPQPRFDLSGTTPGGPMAGGNVGSAGISGGGKMSTGFHIPGAPPSPMQAQLPLAGMRPTPTPGGNAGSAAVPKPAPRSPAGPAVAGARGGSQGSPQVEPPPGSIPVAPNPARSAAPPIDANAWRQLQDAWLFDPMARPALGGIQAGGAGVGVG